MEKTMRKNDCCLSNYHAQRREHFPSIISEDWIAQLERDALAVAHSLGAKHTGIATASAVPHSQEQASDACIN
jgi:hypothetical protein